MPERSAEPCPNCHEFNGPLVEDELQGLVCGDCLIELDRMRAPVRALRSRKAESVRKLCERRVPYLVGGIALTFLSPWACYSYGYDDSAGGWTPLSMVLGMVGLFGGAMLAERTRGAPEELRKLEEEVDREARFHRSLAWHRSIRRASEEVPSRPAQLAAYARSKATQFIDLFEEELGPSCEKLSSEARDRYLDAFVPLLSFACSAMASLNVDEERSRRLHWHARELTAAYLLGAVECYSEARERTIGEQRVLRMGVLRVLGWRRNSAFILSDFGRRVSDVVPELADLEDEARLAGESDFLDFVKGENSAFGQLEELVFST